MTGFAGLPDGDDTGLPGARPTPPADPAPAAPLFAPTPEGSLAGPERSVLGQVQWVPDVRDLPPASLGRRLGALFVDYTLLGILAAVIVFALGAAGAFTTGDDEVGVLLGAFLGLLFAALGMVFALPVWMSRTDGRTPGKSLFGIRVVRDSGERMTFGTAFVREFVVKYLGICVIGGSFAVPLLVAVLWPLFDEQDRGLQDLAVSTRVIRD